MGERTQRTSERSLRAWAIVGRCRMCGHQASRLGINEPRGRSLPPPNASSPVRVPGGAPPGREDGARREGHLRTGSGPRWSWRGPANLGSLISFSRLVPSHLSGGPGEVFSTFGDAHSGTLFGVRTNPDQSQTVSRRLLRPPTRHPVISSIAARILRRRATKRGFSRRRRHDQSIAFRVVWRPAV